MKFYLLIQRKHIYFQKRSYIHHMKGSFQNRIDAAKFRFARLMNANVISLLASATLINKMVYVFNHLVFFLVQR